MYCTMYVCTVVEVDNVFDNYLQYIQYVKID